MMTKDVAQYIVLTWQRALYTALPASLPAKTPVSLLRLAPRYVCRV
jgi:hypothetical protein